MNTIMDINFGLIPDNLNEQLTKLEQAISYICTAKKASKICDDQVTYEAIFYIYKMLEDEKFFHHNHDWSSFTSVSFQKILVDMLFFLSGICEDLNLEHDIVAKHKPNHNSTLNQRCVSILEYVITIVFNITENQFKNEILIKFNQNLFEDQILEAFISLLSREKFFKKGSNNFDSQDIILGIVATIRNISENYYQNKEVWKRLEIETVLKDFNYDDNLMYENIIEEIFLNINQKTVVQTLDYCNSFEKKSRLLEDQRLYIDLLLLSKLVSLPVFKEKKEFKKHPSNLNIVFNQIFLQIYKIKRELNFELSKIKYNYPSKKADLNERIISIFGYLLKIIFKVSFNSAEFSLFFGSNQLIEVLIWWLKDEELLNNIRNHSKNLCIIELIVTNLACFSVYSIENKKLWQDLKTTEILFRVIEKFEKNTTIVKQSFNCIGFILSESQIEYYYENLIKFVQKLLEELAKISHAFKNYKNYKKYKMIKKINIELLNEKKEINKYEVSILHGNLLTNTLNILINLSLNSKMKKLIFKEIESIKMIILKGYFIERYLSLKLLAQLCFEEENCLALLNNESKFIDYLRNLLKNPSQNNEQMKSTCENILISLNVHLEKTNENSIAHNNESNNRNIMISFYSLDTTNQSFFIEIKNELEKYDYKVLNENDSFMNVNKNIRLIEQSNHVLIFLCEKYRLNENCQLEAKHAFKLKKRIIPLIIENNFEIFDGWLQDVLSGKKILILNNKKSLHKFVNRVIRELENFQIENAIFTNQHSLVENWTSNQVEN